MDESQHYEPHPIKSGFLRDVLQQLDDFVCVWDRKGRYVFANKKLERLWGAREEEYLGKTFKEVPFSTVKSEFLADIIFQAIKTGKPVSGTFPYTSSPGRPGFAEYVASPLFDEEGNVEYIAGMARDVTSRKRTEQDLQDSEQQYRLLFDSIEQGFCLVEILCDEHGQPIDFKHLKTNPAYERQTGISGAEGRMVSEVVPGLKERWGETWCRVARTGKTENHISKSPVLGRWFDTTIIPVEGPGSRRIAFLFSDITERRNEELELQEADRRKDEFLATLAHELRNPLAAIRTGLEVIMLAGKDSAVIDEAYETIERQSRQLVALVDDLLEVSRIKRGKVELHKQAVEMAEVLKDAIEATLPMMRIAGQHFTLDLPREQVLLYADPYRLVQIFTNLLNNASRYTPGGGHIRIACHAECGEAVVSVEDTGMGIPQDMLSRIFDMFVQVDRPQQRGFAGLGLGLTLTKSLVEMHGGTIGVRSAGSGEGSIFTVSLPTIDASLKGAPEHIETGVGRNRSRVLVVDDNQSAARMLCLLIRILGADVRSAHSGREGLDTAAEFQPDIIFMDLGMPEMDGFEATKAIKSTPWGKNITIVAVTGWGQDEDKRKSKEAGFDLHLIKPVELPHLQKLFSELEEKRNGADTVAQQ